MYRYPHRTSKPYVTASTTIECVPGDTVIKFSLRHDPTKGIGSLDNTVSIPELYIINSQLDMTNINVLNMFLASRC